MLVAEKTIALCKLTGMFISSEHRNFFIFFQFSAEKNYSLLGGNLTCDF